jgi:prefoldin subunit 5
MPDTTFHQDVHQANLDIAVLKAELSHLRRDVDLLAGAVERLTAALNNVNTTMSEARGGWRMMMLLGGASATFGGLLTWLLQHLSLKGMP